jgi:alpha-L-fucosidase
LRVDRRGFLLSGAAAAYASPIRAQAAQPFSPSWESLASHYRMPDWFRDAKFGIWAHWGPQCQPEWGDWYARLMYVRGRQPWFPAETAYEHHLEHYGHPSRTGFLDIIGQWKAENWQPEYLLKRYQAAGARYVVAMGCHHDNLDLFASQHPAWNSVRVGPKRDVLGTWAPLVRDAGLKFGVSNHSGHAWHWYQVAYGYDAEGPMRGRRYDAYWLRKPHGRGKFWDGLDPQDLYTGPYYVPPDGIASDQAMLDWHEKRDGQWLEGVTAGNVGYVEKWLARQKQMVEEYRPDIVYLDHQRVPFGEYGLEAVAHYYDQATRWHGRPDVVITAGQAGPFERRALVSNVERGTLDAIQPEPWQTATCIGNWHYSRRIYEEGSYKSARQVVQMLADVVSKNGNLLLSIPVRGDGSIDDKEEAILDEIAAWTRRNGEAIFGTRPWRSFGEGPATRSPAGAFGEDKAKPPTSEDVRFATKGGAVHAIFMEWPERERAIGSLGTRALPEASVEKVELLGGPSLEFRRDADALRVTLPPRDGIVPAIRILGRGLV